MILGAAYIAEIREWMLIGYPGPMRKKKGKHKMPKLLYQGHGSYRLTADDGRIIYVDPYKGKGYDAPADIILVTHQHHDHNMALSTG